MSFPGEGTHITTDMWFVVGRTHITRVMCFPSRGTHICIDMCSSTWKTHIASDKCFRDSGTHITRDSFVLYWVYITQRLTYSATYVFYLTSRKVSCFFFFPTVATVPTVPTVPIFIFLFNYYNVLYFRSEDDLHSVKITHEDPVTKVDKVQ